MTFKTKRRAICAAMIATASIFAQLAASSDARAAGLYFSDRGVRPLGRGGAFVAGADDLGGMWYNPAGIVDAGSSLLADFSWLHFSSDYTRTTQLTNAQGTLYNYSFPTVSGTTPVLPIPTLGGSLAFGDKKEYVAALGVMAPYTAIATYPLTVNNQPAPSRYSLVSLDGSALVVLGGYFAMKPADWIRLGAGLQLLTGSFKSTVDFSASPQDALVGAPEDPTYDAFSSLNVGPIFAPSGNLGAIISPADNVRIGASFQLPFMINAPATVQVRLPQAVEFDKASQQGQDAHVKFALPAVFRIGIEVRPTDQLRAEIAYVREFWSAHDAININPDNIQLLNVTGFPSPFAVTPISIPRNFQDSNSVRIGGEYGLKVSDYALNLRAGVNFETTAIPEAYVSPLTIDSFKVTPAIGAGLHISEHWRLDAVIAHVFASDVEVTPQEAAVPRVNPVKGNPVAIQAINGGTYSARADVLGVGLQYKF
jgi:long-chain fatty acid transport protein